MIDSAKDALRAVEFCRYPPKGRRGFGPVRASRYLRDMEEYRREANGEIALFVQIETPEAVQNAPEIFGSAGVDGVFIGNGDLASFMNHGQAGSDEVQQVVNRLIDMARSVSMPTGLPVWSGEECEAYVRRGACLLTVGSDLGFLANGARADLSKVRRFVETAKRTTSEP